MVIRYSSNLDIIGEGALQKVQWLGSRVTDKEAALGGVGRSVFETQVKRQRQNSTLIQGLLMNSKEKQVWEALASLENDSKY
jgi:hypothetical protein